MAKIPKRPVPISENPSASPRFRMNQLLTARVHVIGNVPAPVNARMLHVASHITIEPFCKENDIIVMEKRMIEVSATRRGPKRSVSCPITGLAMTAASVKNAIDSMIWLMPQPNSCDSGPANTPSV